jgi:TRAP-type mannitol/chloroaromatic compound transport system substrate-binding protein
MHFQIPLPIACVLVGVFFLSACETTSISTPTPQAVPEAKAPSQIDWTMQSAFGSQLPIIGTHGKRISQEIRGKSNGKIILKYYEPGEAFEALDIFSAVRHERIDAGHSSPAYFVKESPAFVIFSGTPYAPSASEHYSWIRSGEGKQLHDQLYAAYGLKAVPCVMIGEEGLGWFRKPIDSPEDLRGLKIRAFGFGGKVLEELGVSTKTLVGAAIYPALEKGDIDATEFSVPYIDVHLGFYQITKLYYYPSWHQPFSMYEVIFPLRQWNRLSMSQQVLIESVCHENVLASLEEDKRLRAEALDRLRTLYGVDIRKVPQSIWIAGEKAWATVSEELSRQNSDFARIHVTYKKYFSK